LRPTLSVSRLAPVLPSPAVHPDYLSRPQALTHAHEAFRRFLHTCQMVKLSGAVVTRVLRQLACAASLGSKPGGTDCMVTCFDLGVRQGRLPILVLLSAEATRQAMRSLLQGRCACGHPTWRPWSDRRLWNTLPSDRADPGHLLP